MRPWAHGVVGACLVVQAAAVPAGPVSVWVELNEPALAQARQSGDDMTARRERILAEQARVMTALRGLGGVEEGRTLLTRNALAVRLPAERLDAVRRIAGVRNVRVVRDLARPPIDTRAPTIDSTH